jgi:hypothetical protein
VPDPYIPAEDRIDVIGRLTARLSGEGGESLRDKASVRAQTPPKKEPFEPSEKFDKEFGKELPKDDKEGKDDKESGKDEKDDYKEEKDGDKEYKDAKDDDKDDKEYKDGDGKEHKDAEKEWGKDDKEDKDDKDGKEDKDGPEKDLETYPPTGLTTYIPAEDRFDVIGRLTARLSDDGQESLRDKASAAAEDQPSKTEPPFQPGEKVDKEVAKEEQEQKELSKDGLKDDKEGKEGKEGEKDDKDHKDGDDKDVEKDPKEGIFEAPPGLLARPGARAERERPRSGPVM